MNFTIKYHKPAQACMCLNAKSFTEWTGGSYYYSSSVLTPTNTFKDVNGNSFSGLINGFSTSTTSSGADSVRNIVQDNTKIYRTLTAYASSESIEDFDDDAYSITSVGTATQSFAQGDTNCTYVVNVSNASGQSDITVNSIKFTKPLWATAQSGIRSTCLMYSCYLDAPVVIPAGEEKVFVVVFNFLNP